ncbi:hypothetical protein PVAP13_3KG109827 [Panicum virgatum]|uniref:Uncharacterized protein n=1 Tax=Panicum virgatum TaxID=38727 RepID=A0A8T0UTS0_PANVG|nr:hypothetical protein PVAP13_3KG109827 [Panicum virgatum]
MVIRSSSVPRSRYVSIKLRLCPRVSSILLLTSLLETGFSPCSGDLGGRSGGLPPRSASSVLGSAEFVSIPSTEVRPLASYIRQHSGNCNSSNNTSRSFDFGFHRFAQGVSRPPWVRLKIQEDFAGDLQPHLRSGEGGNYCSLHHPSSPLFQRPFSPGSKRLWRRWSPSTTATSVVSLMKLVSLPSRHVAMALLRLRHVRACVSFCVVIFTLLKGFVVMFPA